jgi:hypothetical protein
MSAFVPRKGAWTQNLCIFAGRSDFKPGESRKNERSARTPAVAPPSITPAKRKSQRDRL